MVDSIQDVGHNRGGSSAGSVRNAVVNDLYRDKAGNCCTVGGFTTKTRSVCRGEGLQGGWMQEGGLLMPRGEIVTTTGHLGRNLAGSEKEKEIGRERHAVGARGGWCCSTGSRNSGTEMGDAQVGE